MGGLVFGGAYTWSCPNFFLSACAKIKMKLNWRENMQRVKGGANSREAEGDLFEGGAYFSSIGN